MANLGNIFAEQEAIADEFDPVTFANQLLLTIQTVRSDNGVIPDTFFTGPLDITGAKNGESRINAFLRILGFPATRNEDKLTNTNDRLESFRQNILYNPNFSKSRTNVDKSVEAERLRLLSQDGTLNYVSPDILDGLSSDLLEDIISREQNLSRKISQDAFLKMLADPLPIGASVSENRPQTRPGLFPLVVSADIPIFPLKKRMAPAFYNGDYILNRKRLSRPFIEHIIYIRLRTFSGEKSPFRDFLVENIQKEVREELGETNPIKELLSDLDNFQTIELQLIQKLIKGLKISAKRYSEIQAKVTTLKTKADWVPVPKSEPNEKVGDDSSLSQEERDEKLQKVAEVEQEITSKIIDLKISNIQKELNSLDKFLQLLPSEIAKQRDEIRRLDEQASLANITDDLFLAEFNYLTTFERDILAQRLQEAKAEKARLLQEYENCKREIMYYTGEFLGLSIFDIICILLALFTVEEKYLLALLNKDAQNRLLENEIFYTIQSNEGPVRVLNPGEIDSVVPDTSAEDPGTAVFAIQSKVTEYFALAEAFFNNFKTPENKQNRK